VKLKGRALEAAGEEITTQLDALGVSPLAELAEMLHGSIELDDADLEKPEFRNLLQDYEPYRNDKGKLCLRVKTQWRARILLELLQYTKPKLRSSEVNGKVDNTLTINIVRFGDTGEITSRKTELIDIPGRIPAQD